MTRETKSACVAALTEAFVQSTGHSADILTIHIEEHSYDNVGVGGKLLSELYPELKEKERRIREEQS